MKNKDELLKACIIEASGSFLCVALPEDYEDMSDDELYQFCHDNAWQPFEYWNGEDIFEQIETTANSFRLFIEKMEADENIN
jgi:hypothetical protein